MNTENSKKPINSKVLWFNILSVVAIVVTALMGSEEFKQVAGDNAYMLVVANATINGVLRQFTTEPLTTSKVVKERENW